MPAQVEDQVRWFVTEAGRVRPLPTVDRTRPAAAVEFDSTDAELLTGADDVTRPGELLFTMVAAEAAGAASTALHTTARYATERRQFGLPIGTFQAVKHKLADMLVAVENARSAVFGAAWALAENDFAPSSVAMAQAVGTGNAVRVVGDAIQLHGGIGVTWECDLHLYLRRTKHSSSPTGHRPPIARGSPTGCSSPGVCPRCCARQPSAALPSRLNWRVHREIVAAMRAFSTMTLAVAFGAEVAIVVTLCAIVAAFTSS